MRHEYRLTAKGRDLTPVILAIVAYGNRHHCPEGGPTIQFVDATSGQTLDPVLVDRSSQQPIRAETVRAIGGPGASSGFAAELARRAALKAAAATSLSAPPSFPAI